MSDTVCVRVCVREFDGAKIPGVSGGVFNMEIIFVVTKCKVIYKQGLL